MYFILLHGQTVVKRETKNYFVIQEHNSTNFHVKSMKAWCDTDTCIAEKNPKNLLKYNYVSVLWKQIDKYYHPFTQKEQEFGVIWPRPASHLSPWCQ